MMNKLERLARQYSVFKIPLFLLLYTYQAAVSLVSLVFRIFPIDDKKIVFCNMKGKRYGDNPKYICDEIMKRNLDYRCIWLLKNEDDEEIPEGVIVSKYSFWKNMYHLCTAKVWVDSNTKYLGILKRKKQLYIQTWHGSYGLKKVYGDLANEDLSGNMIVKWNTSIADIMLSNSRQCSEIFRRAFWYDGEILENGSPRNDIFFGKNDGCYQKVARTFHCTGKKIALYAPTFRNNLKLNAFDLDFYRLKNTLEEKFGSEWVVMIRLHPNNMQSASEYIRYDKDIINATDYDVMQELLVASDLLITDYSSCMFDFVTQPKVCMLYASDIGDYANERGWYFDLKDLPFPLAANNEELEKNIREFDYASYKKAVGDLHQFVGLNETGNASGSTVDYIEKWIGKQK